MNVERERELERVLQGNLKKIMEKKSSWRKDMQPSGHTTHGSAMLLCSPILGILISMTLLLGSQSIYADAAQGEAPPPATLGASEPCASTPSGAGSDAEPCAERRVASIRT